MGHMVIVFRLATNELFQERGRGYWRMNVSLLQEKYFKTELARKWMDWTRYKLYYSTIVLWWTRFLETKIKRVFTLEGARQKQEVKCMENFCYEAMYAATRDIDDTRTLHAAHGTLKAKIVNLHQGQNQRYFLGTTEGEQQDKEQPMLFNLIRKWKRQKQHHVETVRDEQGNLCTSTAEKLRVFWNIYGKKLA
jgi:hypothetical protein